MDAAEGYAPPPGQLTLAWGLEQFHALPEAGGYLEQDAKLMSRMTALPRIFSTVTALRNMKGAEIHNLTTHQRKLIRWLRDEGYM